ncbi:phosphate acetyltransferase [Micrococcus sp. ACRRV]|uniref:phosphate acetyltransferase n=1 Tax=Micrococcus sp. ACRRV TaxID=2918203 RepID=UPI001EF1857F|nr:phosphate acetyltransferase [Micrococcus sp. ACRRV]MCG7423303.1 phosphate acetyltransferase [Micrococcus sp. ACRRV]
MPQGILVTTTTAGAGKSLVSLGLADSLYRRSGTVGYFRPVVPGDDVEADPMVLLMREQFGLTAEQARGGITAAEARSLMAEGRGDELQERCVEVYDRMARECGVVVVEGTDLTGADAAADLELNARLALNLSTPVVAVVSGAGLGAQEAADAVDLTRHALAEAGADLLAVMVNRADAGRLDEIAEAIRPGRRSWPVYVLPELPELAHPSVAEVAAALDLEQVAGRPTQDRDVTEVKAVSMEGGNFLEVLRDGALVIVSGDRSDAILATLASSLTPDFPTPSGMILTNGILPNAQLQRLYQDAAFPVLATDDDTFGTAADVSRVRSELSSAQPRKTAAALGTWHQRVDGDELLQRIDLPRTDVVTPLRFLHDLIERARADRRTVVLPEGEDARVLRAAEILQRRDVCDLVVLGGEAEVRELASREGVDLTGITLVDPATSEDRERYAAEYRRLRSHKGVDLERAREVMLEGAYYGTMMVHLGDADGMVSGAAHTTANTIRPALEFVKTKPGVSIVSSVFFMLLPDRALVYGDCAVNPDPDARQLADIAAASAETAAQFGVDPRVAMLSYSTGASGSGDAVDKVRAATELVRAAHPELKVEGPLQYDAAVNASVAASKMPGSEVAGQATVFVFPDLNTGNNTYKAVQQSSGAVAVGPVLQGLNRPVNDLSRGTTVEDIVNTVAITVIQAQTGSPQPTPKDAP